MTTERPYLFIGGPLSGDWRLMKAGEDKLLIPQERDAWEQYQPHHLKSVQIHWEHKTYTKRYLPLSPTVAYPVFTWDDWDMSDIQDAFGEYMKFILDCEGNVDES